MVGVAVNNTLVPEQTDPDGEAAMVTLALPDEVFVRVRAAKIVPVLTPAIVPVIEEGLTFPLAADVLVGCTCKPVMVIWSIWLLPVPFMVMLKDEEVNVPRVTLVIFLAAVKARVGLTDELNCQPVGGANTIVIDHEPLVLPMSFLFPSFNVIVPSEVHNGDGPVEA